MLKTHSIKSKKNINDPSLFLTLNARDANSIFIEDYTTNRPTNLSQSSLIGTNQSIENKNRSQKTLKGVARGGNGSMRKLGVTLFNLFHHSKQPTSKKMQLQYSSIKSRIKQSSSRVLKTKHRTTNSQLLEARSLQLDEQLKQLHTKRQNEIMEKNLNHPKSSQKYIQSISIIQLNRLSSVPQIVISPSTQNLHRKLQNEIKRDQRQREKNGFYTKLKIKLKSQMDKIEAKKTQGKQNFLVQGCRILKYDPEMEGRRKPLTDRPRPQSCIARSGVEYQSGQLGDWDRRPKTSRSRTVERKQIEYMSANADDIFKKKPKPARSRTGKRSLAKKGQFNFQSTMNKTFKHINPLYLMQNQSANHQSGKNSVRNEKIKERMLTLLVDCDNQTDQYSKLDKGLKIFKNYTNRMNKGLSEVSKMLQDAQLIGDSYGQFQEK